jgi:hypothetical protein
MKCQNFSNFFSDESRRRAGLAARPGRIKGEAVALKPTHHSIDRFVAEDNELSARVLESGPLIRQIRPGTSRPGDNTIAA